ncbi:hypothetical protein U9M48_008378 [Paspalum notatum var. saurae]|uniref:Uncharacterized protein n=1 Tax=Paspalum notatum var. saurae TaxID=547442 RepID=A0AAQ3SP29_PASNO
MPLSSVLFIRVLTPNSRHSSVRKHLQLTEESKDEAADVNRKSQKREAYQTAIMNAYKRRLTCSMVMVALSSWRATKWKRLG